MENNVKVQDETQSLQSCVSVSVTDLRIGNLVEYNGIIMKISEICSPKPLKDKRYSDKYIIELFDGAGLLNCTLDEIKLIVISHKWLLKSGFIYDENWHYRLGENSITRDYLLDICWIDGDLYPFYRNGFFKIKSLNQLQNLYFDLTGYELQIGNLTEH